MFENLLRKFNIDRSTLNAQERETLQKWSEQLAQKQLMVSDIVGHVNNMIDSLERELHGHETPPTFTAFLFRNKRNRHLAARLQNYIMLRDFMQAPDKARKFVEAQLLSLKK